jgi:2'-5' RNA ligase
MRLFTAVLLDAAALDALCGAMEALRRMGVRGNYTRRENLHLTLSFLGEQSGSAAAERALRALQSPAVSLHIGGVGRFRRDSDLLWAGVKAGPDLLKLQSRQEALLRQEGFSLPARAYRPNLTLVREAAVPAGIPFAEIGRLLPPLTMPAARVSLMRSDRVGGRLCYTELFAQELKKGVVE